MLRIPETQFCWHNGTVSSDSNQLVVPPVKLCTYGRRAFSVSDPVVWNSLPDYLRDHIIIPWFVQALSQNLPFCTLLINSRRLSALETQCDCMRYTSFFIVYCIVLYKLILLQFADMILYTNVETRVQWTGILSQNKIMTGHVRINRPVVMVLILFFLQFWRK